MRNTLALTAAALLTLSASAFAQSAPAPRASDDVNGTVGRRVEEGRGAARDDSTATTNASRRGTESNGNANGNNMTRSNGS